MDEAEIERLRARIGELVRERQELRSAGAGPGRLERNRLQLVNSHSELGRALIALHAPSAAS